MPLSSTRRADAGARDAGAGAPFDDALASEFERWRVQNERGGWRCRWRRRSVWGAQLAQRAGLHLRVSAPLFFGARMRVVTGEVMSSALIAFGYIEAALTALMLRTVRPGDVVVDVGTHFGYEALLAARLVGPTGRVLSFEPNPDAFAIARYNLAPYANVTLEPVAVGEHAGTLNLDRPPIERTAFTQLTDDGAAARTVVVPLTSLDRALADRTSPVRFLKVDVEGFEDAVLRGATTVLRHDAPLIVLEADMPDAGVDVSPRALSYAEFLRDFGYAPYAFDYDGRFRVGPLGALRPGHANVAFAAGDDRALLEGLAGT